MENFVYNIISKPRNKWMVVLVVIVSMIGAIIAYKNGKSEDASWKIGKYFYYLCRYSNKCINSRDPKGDKMHNKLYET